MFNSKKEEISNEKFIDVNNNILGGDCEERNQKNIKLYKKIWEYISEDVEKQLEYNITF